MSATVSGVPADRPESLADDIAGIGSFFIDPSGAARRVFHKWFWLAPLVVISIVGAIAVYTRMPYIQHVMEVSPPPNVNPEQLPRVIGFTMTLQRVFLYLAPVFTAFFLSLQALILFAMCSVLAVNAKFRMLLNLVAGCWLIQSLSDIASLIILKAKGEASTMAELTPPLGLDIFLSEGSNKLLLGFLGFFSLFGIWWIVMLVLVFSAAFRVSKGKAFMIILPLLIIGLAFKMLMAMRQQ